jgi:hypothetical protein
LKTIGIEIQTGCDSRRLAQFRDGASVRAFQFEGCKRPLSQVYTIGYVQALIERANEEESGVSS